MAQLSLVKGSTSQTVNVFAQDSASTTGAGKTGLAFNTAGLTAHYCRPRSAAAAITLATQTPTGAYASGGFVEVDATNMPGWYRLDLPDAMLLTGVNSVDLLLKGTGVVPLPIKVELTATDNQNASSGGMANLDAAVSTRSVYAGGPVASVTGAVGSVTGNVGGDVLGTVATVTTLANLPAAPADWLSAAAVSAGAVTKVQAGLSTYAGTDTAGTTTLLTRVTGAVALASQIPTSFTAATFASPGVFSAGALANAPTGTGGGADTPGTTTLLARLTALRSANLDNLDAAVSTRMAAGAVALSPTGLDAVMVGSLNLRRTLVSLAGVVAGNYAPVAGSPNTYRYTVAGVVPPVATLVLPDATSRTITLTPPE